MQEETMNGIGELAGNENIVIDYSDEDIIIIDNTKKLSEPNPTRTKMNIIAIVKKGRVFINVNGKNVTLAENQLLLYPPQTTLSDFMFSADFDFKAIFLTNRIIQDFLHEKATVWNEMMYIHKMNVITLKPSSINFFFNFYDAMHICFEAKPDENPYKKEVIQSLLRSALLELCGTLKTMMPQGGTNRRRQADVLFQRFAGTVQKTIRLPQETERNSFCCFQYKCYISYEKGRGVSRGLSAVFI